MINIDGLLLLDKPEGMTSHDVVNRARRALKRKDVGHAGTLDPMATGLMVLLIGEATKISDYVLNGDKGYELTAELGYQTDSLDRTGQRVAEKEVLCTAEEIQKAILSLEGSFNWDVPLFSAAKIDGQKLYQLAHRGETRELPKKDMSFSNIQILSIENKSIRVRLSCSKGSFIRTWVDELGKKLGTYATLVDLRRVVSMPYEIKNTIEFDRLASELPTDIWQKWQQEGQFIPLGSTLADWPTITVRGKDERLLFNGQISFDLERRLIIYVKKAIETAQTVRIRVLSADSGRLLAILEAFQGQGLKIKRVFR
jgi:tRNA pseudouridine55 synthase